MPIDKDKLPYLMVSLTGEKSVDVIRCVSASDYITFTDRLKTLDIGFQVISEADAIKLMVAGKAQAIGCYLDTGEPTKNKVLAACSHSLYLGLSSFFGVVTDDAPKMLSVDTLSKVA